MDVVGGGARCCLAPIIDLGTVSTRLAGCMGSHRHGETPSPVTALRLGSVALSLTGPLDHQH